ncbi:MAG: hypothetical protein LBG94_01985 [Treponema sp.]|nr:hypothetical protein [Treponema sp.]
MRFYKCECGYIWLPKMRDSSLVCKRCNNNNAKPLKDITAYQCKNRSGNGVVLLNSDGTKAEMKLSWDEFNGAYEYVDTDKFWAEKKKNTKVS